MRYIAHGPFSDPATMALAADATPSPTSRFAPIMNTCRLLLIAGLAAALQLPSPAELRGQESVSREAFDRMMTEVSNARRWGIDDQMGTLNLITPAVRLAALQSVRDGVAVSMSLDVDRFEGVNTRVPLEHEFNVVGAGAASGWALESLAIDYHGYTFSHIDGLGHAIYGGRLYNGMSVDQITDEGATRAGVEQMRNGIVTRGVLIDLPRHLGVPYLEPGRYITVSDLEGWERTSGVTVREGDVLLIRTGRWAREAEVGEWRLTDSAAGPHPELARWLKDRGVVVLGGDNTNERYPSIVPPFSPIHLLTLVSMGMPLLDNLDLEAVATAAAERGRSTFLFVGSPLPIIGGVGSPMNPLAIF